MDGWFYAYWFPDLNEYLVLYTETPRFRDETSGNSFVEVSRDSAQHIIEGANVTYQCTAFYRCNEEHGHYSCRHLWRHSRLCPYITIALLMKNVKKEIYVIEFENIYPVMMSTIVQYFLHMEIAVIEVSSKKVVFTCTDDQHKILMEPRTFKTGCNVDLVYKHTAIHLCQATSKIDTNAATITFTYPEKLELFSYGPEIKKHIKEFFVSHAKLPDDGPKTQICISAPKGLEWTRLMLKFLKRPSFKILGQDR